jgi:hypothetical protein
MALRCYRRELPVFFNQYMLSSFRQFPLLQVSIHPVELLRHINSRIKTVSTRSMVDEINSKDIIVIGGMFLCLISPAGISALGARYRSCSSLHDHNLFVGILQSDFGYPIYRRVLSSHLISNYNNPIVLHQSSWYGVLFPR